MINFKDTKEQWEKLLPYIQTIRTTYTKDVNLVRYVEVMVNKVEPALSANEIVSEYVTTLHGVLSSEYYYRNRVDIRQDEENFLKDFFIHLDLFLKLANKEERFRDEPVKKEEEKRKPNIIDDVVDLYEKPKNDKGRII